MLAVESQRGAVRVGREILPQVIHQLDVGIFFQQNNVTTIFLCDNQYSLVNNRTIEGETYRDQVLERRSLRDILGQPEPCAVKETDYLIPRFRSRHLRGSRIENAQLASSCAQLGVSVDAQSRVNVSQGAF